MSTNQLHCSRDPCEIPMNIKQAKVIPVILGGTLRDLPSWSLMYCKVTKFDAISYNNNNNSDLDVTFISPPPHTSHSLGRTSISMKEITDWWLVLPIICLLLTIVPVVTLNTIKWKQNTSKCTFESKSQSRQMSTLYLPIITSSCATTMALLPLKCMHDGNLDSSTK